MASRSKREIFFSKLKKHKKQECISFDIHSCFLDEKRSETNLHLTLADGSRQLLSGLMLFRTSGYLILSPNRRGLIRMGCLLEGTFLN